MKLINIGFGNMVSAGRLIAIVSPESAPIKRMVQEARDRGVLIDATYGRRTRAVLIMDSDHIVLSALQPDPEHRVRRWGRMKLINIGFGNMVSAGRLIAIVSPESAPIKRMVQEARDRGVLIDATYGRRTRAVLIMDSDHIVLSALQPETVAGRLGGRENEPAPEEDEDA